MPPKTALGRLGSAPKFKKQEKSPQNPKGPNFLSASKDCQKKPTPFVNIFGTFMFLGIFLMFALLEKPLVQASFPSLVALDATNLEQEIVYELSKDHHNKVQERPVLILVGGFPGAGKTTLLRHLKELYDAQDISTDVIRQALFNRGIKLSAEFSTCVANISKKMIRNALNNHLHIFFDANAHSRVIVEIENLLEKERSQYSVIKIFLNTSEETLIERIRKRDPLEGCYQGTEHDLQGALASTKINLDQYDLVVDTDKLSEKTDPMIREI
jgi:dephospho-CoA kinase